MGARQSKRSVDITATPKRTEGEDQPLEGKLEKIEERDLKPAANGATAHSAEPDLQEEEVLQNGSEVTVEEVSLPKSPEADTTLAEEIKSAGDEKEAEKEGEKSVKKEKEKKDKRDFYQGPPWNQPPPPYPQQQMQQNSPHHPQQHDQQQQQPQHHQGDSDQQDPNHSGKSYIHIYRPWNKEDAERALKEESSHMHRPWNKEDAERALKEESSHMKGLMRNQSLIIRFPDPELSKDIVKAFHPGIDNVHFQVPSGARYCFVQLAEDVNAESAIKELEQTKFGAGKLVVEKKYNKEEEDLTPEAIDPYTLYIGNLPKNVNVASMKEKFPTAARIDIGFIWMKEFTRCAFFCYNNVDEAIEAYRKTNNLLLDSRSIIVRFRRMLRHHVGLPGESKLQKPPKELEKKRKSKSKKEEKIAKLKIEQAAKLKVEKDEDKSNEEDEEEEEEDDDDNDLNDHEDYYIYIVRPWNKEDAERALKEESSHMKGLMRNQSLIIRFPDPELSEDIVKAFHPGIDNVHFQVPSGARYCFVQLAEDVNAESAIKELEQTKFGAGKLVVKKTYIKEEKDLTPEAIDPYTLYIGNLPKNVNFASMKEKFPTAARIDIGYTRMKEFTSYAFLRYNNVDEAIEALRKTNNLLLDSRSIIVRFRRLRRHVGLPGESKLQKPPKELEKKRKSKSKKEEKIAKLKIEQAAKLKVEKDEDKSNEDEEEEEEDDDDNDLNDHEDYRS